MSDVPADARAAILGTGDRPTSRLLARLVTRTRALDDMGSTSGPS
jgi:hypothetical protein